MSWKRGRAITSRAPRATGTATDESIWRWAISRGSGRRRLETRRCCGGMSVASRQPVASGQCLVVRTLFEFQFHVVGLTLFHGVGEAGGVFFGVFGREDVFGGRGRLVVAEL